MNSAAANIYLLADILWYTEDMHKQIFFNDPSNVDIKHQGKNVYETEARYFTVLQ